MELGIVGLGKIGSGLALHGLEKGHQVAGLDRRRERAEALRERGLRAAADAGALCRALSPPRTILLYVPQGAPTDSAIADLVPHLAPGDLLADGGNSHYRDSVRRHAELRERGLRFLDVGTSGGVAGARSGACFMVGGDAGDFAAAEPLLRDLAVPGGVIHAGRAGAGHFVKLIHNAIEFGMVQAIAEGVDLLSRSDFDLDLGALFHNWSHGSVIRGWLVELMERGLRERPLEDVGSAVEDTREVRWAVEYALQVEAWIPVIASSELALYRYRDEECRAGRSVALLRHGFGGHPLPDRRSP